MELNDAHRHMREVFPDEAFNESLEKITEGIRSAVEQDLNSYDPALIVVYFGEDGLGLASMDLPPLPDNEAAREIVLSAIGRSFYQRRCGAPVAVFITLPILSQEARAEIVDGEEYWVKGKLRNAILVMGGTIDDRLNSSLIYMEQRGDTYAPTGVEYHYFDPSNPLKTDAELINMVIAGYAEELNQDLLNGGEIFTGEDSPFSLRGMSAEMLFGERTAEPAVLVRAGVERIAAARIN